jgi:hypothetical protein
MRSPLAGRAGRRDQVRHIVHAVRAAAPGRGGPGHDAHRTPRVRGAGCAGCGRSGLGRPRSGGRGGPGHDAHRTPRVRGAGCAGCGRSGLGRPRSGGRAGRSGNGRDGPRAGPGDVRPVRDRPLIIRDRPLIVFVMIEHGEQQFDRDQERNGGPTGERPADRVVTAYCDVRGEAGRCTDQQRHPGKQSGAASGATAGTSLIAYNVIHATLGLALGGAATLLILDGLGWRITSAAFHRERLITGTR